ncbi:hypothetical protein IH824_06285 [candidate division KSB1 bacterium]|nr:hypothetical protein [candidate division KSB1 bacterium]
MDEIFKKRIERGNEKYCTFELGAIGSVIATISNFFEKPWSHPSLKIAEHDQAFLLSASGFFLRALGRLREVSAPMQAGMELSLQKKHWKGAAVDAGNLSELFLMLGEVQQAVDTARPGVGFADRSGDAFEKWKQRYKLAGASHQIGKLDEAEILFKESEALQKNNQPYYNYLYSLGGFLYCDLLLGLGQVQEVLERAGQTLEWASGLLNIALDNLSLGRAHFLQSIADGSTDYSKAESYLNQAVAGLREAGAQDMLPLGYFARAALYRVQQNFAAAWEDLSEAHEIAERGEMRLYLADFHLEACRLHLAQHKAGESFVPESLGAKTISPVPENHLEAAKAHLKIAKEMINKMGYHRRDPEVEELQLQIANYK